MPPRNSFASRRSELDPAAYAASGDVMGGYGCPFRVAQHRRVVHCGSDMLTSISLDGDLVEDLQQAESLTREKKSKLIRLAIRVGLPVVVNRFQAPRPEGYFASDYPLPKDRLALEAAMAKVKVKPDR